MTDRIFQVGAGQVGRGLNRAFAASGVHVIGMHSRRPSGSASSHGDLPAIIGDANLVIVSVREPQLDGVMQQLLAAAQGGRLARGTAILHTSAVAEPGALTELTALGFPGGTFHPLLPFTDPERAPGMLRGGWVGIDGDPAARSASRRIAAKIGARTLDIPAGKKPAYHAAAVMASNFPVVLASVASHLLQELGIGESSANHAIESLMSGAMANLAGVSPDAALTGPVVRGDPATVGKHLKALKPYPSASAVYRALSIAAVEIAGRRGVDQETLASLRATIAATARS
jgi:predicted short-subunit dehydrogenase-like oxidoreductase (DUF2520 family)